MTENQHLRQKRHFGLSDVSGTTIAITSLAILGAAAIVTAPLWLWYRRKRKRADALARQAAGVVASPEEAATDAGGSSAAREPGEGQPRG